VTITAAGRTDIDQVVMVVKEGMGRLKIVVARETGDLGSSDAIQNGLRNDSGIKVGAGIAMADRTIGAVQCIYISLAR